MSRRMAVIRVGPSAGARAGRGLEVRARHPGRVTRRPLDELEVVAVGIHQRRGARPVAPARCLHRTDVEPGGGQVRSGGLEVVDLYREVVHTARGHRVAAPCGPAPATPRPHQAARASPSGCPRPPPPDRRSRTRRTCRTPAMRRGGSPGTQETEPSWVDRPSAPTKLTGPAPTSRTFFSDLSRAQHGLGSMADRRWSARLDRWLRVHVRAGASVPWSWRSPGWAWRRHRLPALPNRPSRGVRTPVVPPMSLEATSRVWWRSQAVGDCTWSATAGGRPRSCWRRAEATPPTSGASVRRAPSRPPCSPR